MADGAWRSISATIQEFEGLRYYLCEGRYFQRNGVRLHRVVYEATHGPIPAGYDVHHKDRDKTNNHPGNLEAMPEGDHHREHLREPARIEASRRAMRLFAQPASIAWHTTEAGRAWHRKLGKMCADAGVFAPRHPTVCVYCGVQFLSGHTFGKYCSKNCKTQDRRVSGVDNEQRTCCLCGAAFSVNKYAASQTCSRRCSATVGHMARRATTAIAKEPPNPVS